MSWLCFWNLRQKLLNINSCRFTIFLHCLISTLEFKVDSHIRICKLFFKDQNFLTFLHVLLWSLSCRRKGEDFNLKSFVYKVCSRWLCWWLLHYDATHALAINIVCAHIVVHVTRNECKHLFGCRITLKYANIINWMVMRYSGKKWMSSQQN